MTESDIAAIRDQVKELPEVLDVALGYSVVRRSAVLALLVDTPSVEPLDVERLAEALKEYDAGRLRVPFAPSHVLSPDQSPSRFHRAWAKTLLDYAARLLADTPSVEPPGRCQGMTVRGERCKAPGVVRRVDGAWVCNVHSPAVLAARSEPKP